jgi:hypothetical protein
MALTANDVVSRATLLLNDSGFAAGGVAANTRWTVPELLDWASDAQRQIVLLRPNANNVVGVVQMARGTRQKLPANGWLLISCNRNMTALTGGTGTRAVRQVQRATLDAQNPNWHADPLQRQVWNYMYDVQDQDAFYIYPPNDGNGFLECNYSATPDQLTDLTSPLVLDQLWLTPMVDYVCFRALSKDAEFAGGASLAQLYYQAFSTAVVGRDNAEKQDSPDSTFSAPGPGNYTQPEGRK